MHNSVSLAHTEQEMGMTGEEAFVDLGTVIGHLQNILVCPSSHIESYDGSATVVQPTSPSHASLVQNTITQLEHPEHPEQDNNIPVNQQLGPIDMFLDSISKPLPQPLITQRPRQNVNSQEPEPPFKRHSTRLAQKASANSGKGPIEIAQELLAKKLGNLAANNNIGATPIPDEFDLYTQHFARPIEKIKMDAIQDLIEHGAMIKVKRATQSKDAEEPGRMA
jgi:hypothetical protein